MSSKSVSPSESPLQERIRRLNEIGIALSNERETDALIEQVLLASMELTGAEGGTLYCVTSDSHLVFEIVINTALGIRWGGTTNVSVPLPDIPLFLENGEPDCATVAAACYHQTETINVADVYTSDSYDFSGTRDFDVRNGYRSHSIITVPLRNHEAQTFAIIQLINPMSESGIGVFDEDNQFIVESLASQASLVLNNASLVTQQRKLFESFIELIARAIDDKSPHTAHHCRRVPELTMMLAKAADRKSSGPLAAFSLSQQQEYELRIASWLHDCGKIAIPEWIVDKATKLETRFDRVNLVDTRIEILRRDAEIDFLKAKIQHLMGDTEITTDPAHTREQRIESLKAMRATVRHCNIGVERMASKDQDAVSSMANETWTDIDGVQQTLLSEDELRNLLIERGTLTPEERAMCNEHINITIRMLESLDYPPDLAGVPEIAGSHHERMDGTGFPRGLTGDQMSVQARAMAIADVFESLTADDRPYKKAMPLSQALTILGKMKSNGHIDPDLFDLFVRDGIYRRYADEFLDPSRIDAVDVESLPGFRP